MTDETLVDVLEAVEATLRKAIPERFLLDPPDGDNVPVLEGIQRMADTVARLTRERDEALLARDKAVQALGDEARLRGRTETERDVARSERDEARAALQWYGEQARLARLIHSEGDAGRNALAADGGERARALAKGGGDE